MRQRSLEGNAPTLMDAERIKQNQKQAREKRTLEERKYEEMTLKQKQREYERLKLEIQKMHKDKHDNKEKKNR